MSFREYVDDLAKRGMVDGNIADNLVARHESETANPLAPVRAAVQPILDEMYRYADRAVCGDGEKAIVRKYAERIDDAVDAALKGGAK